MAKFKEKLKKLLSNKLVKAISIIFMCIVGFILLGRCNKIEAKYFTLSDGTNSDITYGEGQRYVSYSANETIYIEFDNYKSFTHVTNGTGSTNLVNNKLYYSCSYTSPNLVCSKIIQSNAMGGSQSNNSSPVTIYKDYFTFKNVTYTKLEILTTEDVNNAYNQGYTAGQNSVDITTDNQAYADNYIQNNNYHTNTDYINYGNTKYQEGYNDRDITTDNQAYADSYIQNNNYHTDSDYKKYGQDKYNAGYTAGQNSVDITIDNESYTYEYIINNNYHSNNEYLEYGNNKYNEGYSKGKTDANNTITTNSASYNAGYTAGQNSVDITTDNQAYTDSYIQNNNYHTNTDYINYGNTKYQEGYNAGENAGFINGSNSNVTDAYNNGYNSGYNQGKIDGINEADNRVNTSSASYINGYASGVSSVDITSDNGEVIINYIVKNNYHTDTDYLNYGNTKYQEGYNEGQYIMINNIINNSNDKYNTSINNVCIEDKSKCNTFIESTNKTIYEKGYNDRDITTDNYQAIQKYVSDNTLYNQIQYENYGKEQYNLGTQTAEGYEEGYNDGYNSGQADAKVSILDFFPGIIGTIIGFFITLMQISIFGVRIFDIIGILFGVGLVVLILKVVNGGGD